MLQKSIPIFQRKSYVTNDNDDSKIEIPKNVQILNGLHAKKVRVTWIENTLSNLEMPTEE